MTNDAGADRNSPTKAPSGRRRSRDPEEVRRSVLEVMLERSADAGWTISGMRAVAIELGVDDRSMRAAFPRGITDLLVYFCARGDAEMARRLAGVDLAALPVRERVARAVRTRLEIAGEHEEAVRRATSLLALPLSGTAGARALYGTVDAIWKALGDTSSDISFYTRRASLAAVYSSTLVFWLADRSAGKAETWTFLDRRIADALNLGKIAAPLVDTLNRLSGIMRPGRRTR